MNTLNTLNIIMMKDVISILETKIGEFNQNSKGVLNYKGKPDFDFDYYDDGFEVTVSQGKEMDIRVMFSSNVNTKGLLSGESILEFKNISIEKIEVDTINETYEVVCDYNLLDISSLEYVGTEIAVNASQYNLVDKEILTTDDINVLYSELSEQYDKYGF